MRQRNTRISRNGDGRCNPRHHLKIHASLDQLLGLFASPAKDKGVPSLESDNNMPPMGPINHQGIDLILALGMAPALLTNIDQLRLVRGILKEGPVGQVIVNNHLGKGKTIPPLDRQKAGVAWTRSHQVYLAFSILYHPLALSPLSGMQHHTFP